MNSSTSTFARSLLMVALPLAALAADRVTRPIDSTRTRSLAHTQRFEANSTSDRGRVNPALLIDGITVVLQPSPEQQASLEKLLEAQRDPWSADYRHWLTPEEFADRFGASANDVAQISSWLQTRGLSVNRIAKGRNWVEVSGTADRVANAFHVEIHHFAVEGKLHYAPTVAPSVPEALMSVISEIRGLDDFHLKPAKIRFTALSPGFTTSPGTNYLSPDDFATIYNIAPLLQSKVDGSGQTIAIVGQSDINLTDIQTFRTKFNLPANVPQVKLYGRDPGTNAGDAEEAALDLEWAGAVARNATLIYVNSRNVTTSAQYAIDGNLAPVLSMSYGGCEQQNSSSLRALAQQANAQGITWVASSGDSGAAGCESGTAKTATHGLAVNIPASIPEVTGIGGTTFSEGAGSFWSGTNTPNLASAFSYIPETSWNDTAMRNELSASGGGVSIFYAKPAWQTGKGVPNDGMRDVPDLAFAASPDHDGYLVYVNSALGVVGGTSAPTPSFAGVLALLNQYLVSHGALPKPGLGNINPSLYHLAQTSASVFHDVASGNNIVPCVAGTANCTTGSLGYSAAPGYDLVTGLGSADIYNLVTNWTNVVASIGTSTTLSSNPSSIPQTASTQLTATVKSVSGTVAPGGTVTFSSGSNTLGSASLTPSGNSGVATITVQGSRFAVGTDPIVAAYAGNTTFSASSGTANLTVTGGAPSGNSQVVPSISPNPVPEVNRAWPFTVTLTEQAGQATTLTNFTINGTSYASQLKSFFGSTSFPAKGPLAADLSLTGVSPPMSIVFGFSGLDPSGRQWNQSLTVSFNGPITATSTH